MIKTCFEKFNKKLDSRNNVIYVFIDASNLWEAQKAKGRFLDYEKTLELRTGGDGYSDILKIDEIWGKELRYRKEKNK